MYEEIINDNIEEEEIKKIIGRIPIYEDYIKKTYEYIKRVSSIGEIEWIKKM